MPRKAELEATIREQREQIQTLVEQVSLRDQQLNEIRVQMNQIRRQNAAPRVRNNPQAEQHDRPDHADHINPFRQMINELRQSLQDEFRGQFEEIRNAVRLQAQPNDDNQPLHVQQQEAAPLQFNHIRNRELLKPYTGKKSRVSPVGWINFFEFRVGNVTDQQKYLIFAEYLADDAQNWLVCQFPTFGPNPQWNTVKQLFINHFSGSIVPPGVAAAQFKFKFGDNLEDYFEKKCHLFELANTQIADQIGFLTDGIEEEYIRDGLIVATINTLPEWLVKANALLNNFERKRQSKGAKGQSFKPASPNAGSNYSNKNPKGEAPSACKNCLREEGVERKHWHIHCPYYKPGIKTSTPVKTSKPAPKVVQHAQIEQQSAESSPSNSSTEVDLN